MPSEGNRVGNTPEAAVFHPVPITFGRGAKIWWSYMWRALVLITPLMVVLVPVVLYVMPHPGRGAPVTPDQLHEALSTLRPIWLVTLVVNVLLQVQAMRWMLKTRWSDFRLVTSGDAREAR
jgi:hypothetical protein